MFTIRRHDLSPRVEMVPLIDVIFLLLTFFIYSLIVMVRAEVVPVALAPVQQGGKPKTTAVHAITVDRAGQLFLDRQPVTTAVLAGELGRLAQDPDQPAVYLALEQAGDVDRGPLLLKLIELVRSSGVKRFAIVGAPGAGAGFAGEP